ncbi:MAG: NAD-dependent epimerase/dehydratase family protein [Terrimicrobiaceae bacterium]
MKSLLVTGATGFVGRNLVLHSVANHVPILAPVRSREKLLRCLEEDGISPDAVSALPAEPDSWNLSEVSHAVLGAGVLFARTRAEYFATNLDWTLRVLRALPPDCRTVVLSSQSAGGPTPDGSTARTEKDVDAPVTWYGESKLELEKAIAREFADRPITILRPPMILGARDSATLPLFKMARGVIRTKPGLRRKEFTFLAVEDVVSAIEAAFEVNARGPFYIGSGTPVSDYELLASAAKAVAGNGITVAVPTPVVRFMAALVDAIPALREAAPSLTKDRAREIWHDRWVVDSSAFRSVSGWKPTGSLDQALLAACRHFQAMGSL